MNHNKHHHRKGRRLKLSTSPLILDPRGRSKKGKENTLLRPPHATNHYCGPATKCAPNHCCGPATKCRCFTTHRHGPAADRHRCHARAVALPPTTTAALQPTAAMALPTCCCGLTHRRTQPDTAVPPKGLFPNLAPPPLLLPLRAAL